MLYLRVAVSKYLVLFIWSILFVHHLVFFPIHSRYCTTTFPFDSDCQYLLKKVEYFPPNADGICLPFSTIQFCFPQCVEHVII